MEPSKLCWICSSGNHVDNHHIDCQYGRLSPETVPLCRRCHQTYHTWDVGAFSPDTTEKAVELENKCREILRSLPADHPERLKAYQRGYLEPLKLEDVRRSSYWYRKWDIKPPPRKRGRSQHAERLPFILPKAPALCGEEWLNQHMRDFTPEDIGSLAIVIGRDGQAARVTLVDKRGTVRKAMKRIGSIN